MIWLLVIGSLVIVGGVWYLINKISDVKSSLADFILAHPETTAVAVYTFDDQGNPIEDGNAIFRNADEPLVMASTMKIIVLAAYAEAAANKELDPSEEIPIADLEKYYLPMSDGNAHAIGLKSVGLKVDGKGFALDQSARISLDDIARIMIHYSGNAETDYLIMRLGRDRIAAILQKAGFEHHDPIRPTLGAALAIFDHAAGALATEHLHQRIAEVAAGDTSYLDHLIDLYWGDEAWRTAQIAFMDTINDQTDNGLDMWAYQTEAGQLFPKGTAREYARMMAQIASDRFLSTEISQIMQQKLENIASDWPLRLLYYDRFGAKDGVTAGVLTVASYAVPKRGSLSDQGRVMVLITNELPVESWAEQLTFQGHYLLPIDLAKATGVFSKFADTGRE